MEAQVTIKASVPELDLLRKSIEVHKAACLGIVNREGKTVDDMKEKQEARRTFLQLSDLESRLS